MGKPKQKSRSSDSKQEQKLLSLEKMLKESESLRKLQEKEIHSLKSSLESRTKNEKIKKKEQLERQTQEMCKKNEEIGALEKTIAEKEKIIQCQKKEILSLKLSVERNNFIGAEIFSEQEMEDKERMSCILKGKTYESQPYVQFSYIRSQESNIHKKKIDLFDKISEEIIKFCKNEGEKMKKGIGYYMKMDSIHKVETPLHVLREILHILGVETSSNHGLLTTIKNLKGKLQYTEIYFSKELKDREERIKNLELGQYLYLNSNKPFPTSKKEENNIEQLKSTFLKKETELESQIQEKLIEEQYLKLLFSRYLKEIKNVKSLSEMNEKILEIYKRFNSIYIPELETEIMTKEMLKLRQNLPRMSKNQVLEKIKGTMLEIYGEELLEQRKNMLSCYMDEIYV